MSAENSTAAAPAAQKASKWSDNEKVALLISINKTLGGTPVWNSLSIPAGRTTGSSQKMYDSLLKAASIVPMTEGSAPVPGQKRKATTTSNGSNEDGDTAAKPAQAKKPRARKPKAAAAEGETEAPVKKRAPRKPKKSAAEAPVQESDNEEGAVLKEENEAETLVKEEEKDGEEEVIGDDLADAAQAGYEKAGGEVAV